MAIADPRDIPGLVVWFSAEAETGYSDNDPMTGWTDLSGNGNHAALPSGSTTPPKWRSTAGASGGPAVQFEGAALSAGNNFVLSDVMTGAASGEGVMSIKSSTDTGIASNHWHFGASAAGQTHYPHNGTVYETFGSTSRDQANPALAIDVWRRYAVWSAPNDWAMLLDGATFYTRASSTVGWLAAPLIGSSPSRGSFTGWIAAVIVYDRKLTTTERADLDTWLAANPSGGNVTTPAVGYSAEVLADNPRIYWRLGEATGTVAEDASLTNLDGTYFGTPTLGVAGALVGDADTAVTFDGVNDYVNGAVTLNLAAVTVEAWVKKPSLPASTQQIAGRAGTTPASVLFYIDVTSAGLPRMVVANTAGAFAVASGTVSICNDAWHHVVGTYASGTARLYVDGVEVATAALAGTFNGAPDTSFTVGAQASGTGRFFAGTLDEPAYYATALSAARIAAHYDAGTSAGQTIALGQATEADEAHALAAVAPQGVPLGQATETDAAQPVAAHAPTTVTLGQATEADEAQPLTADNPVTLALGQAEETATAGTLTPLAGGAFVSLGQAAETDTAQPFTADNPATVALGRAVETDTAGTLSPEAPIFEVTFRDAAVYDGGTATSHSITIPATVQTGDTMLLVVAGSNDLGTPSGWTLLSQTNYFTGQPIAGYVFVRTAQAGDAGSSVPLVQTTSHDLAAAIAAYDGVENEPTSVAATANMTSDSTVRFVPGGATLIPGSVFVGMAAMRPNGSNSGYMHAGNGLTQRHPEVNFTWDRVGIADRALPGQITIGDSQYWIQGQWTGRWVAFSVFLEPPPSPITVLLEQAGETDTAQPVTPHRGGEATDTSNRAGGRLRDGLGIATWEPAVVPPPSSTAGVLTHDVAKAFGPVTRSATTQPSYEVSTATMPRQRDRILVGGVDVTYFRGVPTPLPTYQLIQPLLYGPATLVFPQIAGTYEQVGVGALKWLRKGAPVVVQRVNPDTGVVEATDYRGLVIAFNLDGASLSVEVGGQASGRAALINRQPPLWHKVNDAGFWAWSAVRRLRLRFEPRLGPDTGIKLANWGGTSVLDYISELCSKAQDRDGTQWTIAPDAAGVYRFARKDTTTVAATVYLDDAWNVASLRRDIAEEPNRVFMTGINPQGRRVRGAVYPGLNQGETPPYPYTNTATTFGQGTTDADTNTGDGVSVMIARLWAMKYLDLADTPGGYDNDARKAVRALQEDAGLPVTGIMNLTTWRALFDLSATGYSLAGSHIEPMAQRSAVRRWLRTSSGALLARNPGYDPSVVPVDLNVDVGVGFKANQIREWARAELSSGDNWVGTITCNTGAVVNGTHVPGVTLTPADVLPVRSLKPGMNVWCPQFMGGTLFHVSAVSVDPTAVTLSVDTRARDTMKVWAVIQRNRDTRQNPARAWVAQHRSSGMTNDGVAEWDAAGGVIEKIRARAGRWIAFPVAAGQEGTIARLRVRTDPPAEYVMAIFGRAATAEWLEAIVPDPLTVAGTKRWESERIRRRLDNRFLLYAAGTNEQPCGYFPGKKNNDEGPTSDRLTGRHEDDAGVSFRTWAEPVLYVAVWADRDTVLKAGRILWNQLETSS